MKLHKKTDPLDYLTSSLESKLNNGTISICCCKVENREYVFPARLDLVSFSCDHLSHTPHHHIPDSNSPIKTKEMYACLASQDESTYYLLISLHDVLKWSEEVLLKPKVCQFSFLQELHG